jgi:RND family efflux transporter MFP subunit
LRRTIGLVFLLASAPAAAQVALDVGYTRPSAEIRLAFGESGVLRELKVREGQAVAKGELLARLDTAVLEADAEIARAQAQLADHRLKALERVGGEGRVSPDELARARAEAAIEQGRLRRVAAQLENRVLRSSVDGIVTEVKRQEGESVGPSDFTVVTVVRIVELRADLFVSPAVAAAHRPGQAVEVLYDGTRRIPATIEFISPLVEPASGTARMRVTLPNAEGKLSCGMKVSLPGEAAPADGRREP